VESRRQEATWAMVLSIVGNALVDDIGGCVKVFGAELNDPGLGPHERLFFEVYGLALQGRPGTAGLLDDIVDAWVEPIAAHAIARGVPADTARADARLGIAVTRGLLLDLLAIDDRPAVNAALERFITQYEAVQS
jgi:hypothetical protein